MIRAAHSCRVRRSLFAPQFLMSLRLTSNLSSSRQRETFNAELSDIAEFSTSKNRKNFAALCICREDGKIKFSISRQLTSCSRNKHMLSSGVTFSLLTMLLVFGKWLTQSQDASVLLLVSICGIYQYRKEQNWKRKEFAFQSIKSLREVPAYRDMIRVIAWDDCRSEYLGGHNLKCETVAHLLKKDGGSDEVEKKILYTVDEFLTELDMFLFYVRRGLMRWDDVKQHLGYLIVLFGKNSQRSFPLPDRRKYLSWQTRIRNSFTPIKVNFEQFVPSNILASELVKYCMKWDYTHVLWAIANHAPTKTDSTS